MRQQVHLYQVFKGLSLSKPRTYRRGALHLNMLHSVSHLTRKHLIKLMLLSWVLSVLLSRIYPIA
jgi:hypothetical protein